MTMTRKIVPALVALAACGLAAAPADAAKPVAKVAGKRVAPCQSTKALMFVLFVRDVDCRAALHHVATAAAGDRACPRGWKAHKGVRVTIGRHHSPRVTLCTRHATAFTYRLPVG